MRGEWFLKIRSRPSRKEPEGFKDFRGKASRRRATAPAPVPPGRLAENNQRGFNKLNSRICNANGVESSSPRLDAERLPWEPVCHDGNSEGVQSAAMNKGFNSFRVGSGDEVSQGRRFLRCAYPGLDDGTPSAFETKRGHPIYYISPIAPHASPVCELSCERGVVFDMRVQVVADRGSPYPGLCQPHCWQRHGRKNCPIEIATQLTSHRPKVSKDSTR